MSAARKKIELSDYVLTRRVLVLSGVAAIIGVLAALVAKALVWLIGAVNSLAFFQRFAPQVNEASHNHLGGWVVVVPVVGGLIVGLMIKYGTSQIRGHGIPEAMESALFDRSRMSLEVAILKPIGSAVAIGTGGPFGAEGPIIMTGGAIGSLIGQVIELTAAERRILLGAGAAAGMAAIFGSPISSVILAVDLLLYEWRPRSYLPVACAAAVAAAFRVPLVGIGPMFPVGEWIVDPIPWLPGLLGGAGLGLAAGLAAVLVTKLVYWSEDVYRKLPLDLMWWPAIGGLFVGIGGYLQPRALGIGYDQISSLLGGRLVGTVVLGLLAVKATIWAISLASGTSGGVLAPLLIMGGALGAFCARWIPVGSPGLWALVGMGGMLGAGLGSPFTGVVFVVETTNNARYLPELVIAGAVANAIAVLLLRHSLMTEKVVRRGHHVARDYATSPLDLCKVGEVADIAVPSLSPDERLGDAAARLAREDPAFGRRAGWPVVGPAGLVGVLDRAALELAGRDPRRLERPVSQAMTAPLPVRRGEELRRAVTELLLHARDWLPVVETAQPGERVAYLDRAQVVEAWRQRVDEETTPEPGLWRKVRQWLAGRTGLVRRHA